MAPVACGALRAVMSGLTLLGRSEKKRYVEQVDADGQCNGHDIKDARMTRKVTSDQKLRHETTRNQWIQAYRRFDLTGT
jgi:hypothetical protein